MLAENKFNYKKIKSEDKSVTVLSDEENPKQEESIKDGGEDMARSNLFDDDDFEGNEGDFDDYQYDYQYDYDYLESKYIPFEELDEQTRQYVEIAKEKVDNWKNLENTVKPVAKLIFLNELRRGGENGYADADKRIGRIEKSEELYLGIEELPTVGIEVECFPEYLTLEKVTILDSLEIPNYEEFCSLHEVNAGYSYSPYVQARTLEELVKFGAIPKTVNPDGKSSLFNTGQTYSLHVNFGIPDELHKVFQKESFQNNDPNLYAFVDAATYAFVSPNRVDDRKTKTSVKVKSGAEKSKKNKKSTEIDKGDTELFRLEYRANEFRDYTTFRMLAETQRLAAMLFSYLKKINFEETSKLERILSDLWVQFFNQFQEICQKYDIDTINLVDYHRYRLHELLEKTELQKDCRNLLSEFSRKAIKEIKIHYQSNIE